MTRRYKIKYEILATRDFKKDIKNLERQGKDLNKLKEVIVKLSNGEILDRKYCDHSLHGKYVGGRECHIEPDWILIYYIMDQDLILRLSRTGSHSKMKFGLFNYEL